MSKKYSKYLVALAICIVVQKGIGANNPELIEPTSDPEQAGFCIKSGKEGTPVVEIVMGYNGNATMSWDSFGDPGPYTVTVSDLTAFNTIASFSTSNTSANISRLTNGHTYRFEVSKAADTIIVEIIVNG